MVVAAIALIAAGALIALFGLRLFRALLPLAGLVAGVVVGFTGVQAVFGTGVISTMMAVIFSVFTGLLLALLSYFFFELAVIVVAASIGASLFTLIGLVFGLNADGFVVFLLGISGAIIAGLVAASHQLTNGFVVALTAAFGAAAVMAGVLLLIGHTSLDDLSKQGVVRTVAAVIDTSLIWFLAWFGGTLMAGMFQARTQPAEIDLSDTYQLK